MRRTTVAAVGTVVLGGPALGTAAWYVLGLVSVSSRPAYLVGVAAAALTVVQVVRLGQAPVELPVAAADSETEPERRGVPELITLEHRLAWGSVDASRFESRVRPVLVRVAAERLRLRHGVDHTREPDRARSIVGEHLWTLMTAPVGGEVGAPSPRALRRIIERIERI